MQTFMPYSRFIDVAECLDYRRLGKQRVETKQILMTLLGQSSGWANHPVVRAWKGYEEGLCVYGLYMCSEWRIRGYEDNLYSEFQQLRLDLRGGSTHMTEFPPWVYDPVVQKAYRELLCYKEPEHYEEEFDMVALAVNSFPWERMF